MFIYALFGSFFPPQEPVAEEESKLTESLVKIIGESKHVMIYGYRDCGYMHVWKKLSQDIKEKRSFLEGCYSYCNFLYNCPAGDSLLAMMSIPLDGEYKAPLVATVLENCIRKRRREDLIPVIFCVTSSLLSRGFSVENTDIHTGKTRRPTAKELNLVYKLCRDEELTDEIHQVARETFMFVKTIGLDSTKPTSLEKIEVEIDLSWDAAIKKARRVEKPHKSSWRKWLVDRLK